MLARFAAQSENQHLKCQCTLLGNRGLGPLSWERVVGSSERDKMSWGLEIDRQINVALAVIWMLYHTQFIS